jgi:hypothetical protein
MAIRKFSTASVSAGSNKSTKLWDQETLQSGMFALATVSLTSTASSIVFSGIPQNYTHLQVRGFLRSDKSADTNADLYLWLNGDLSSNNYTRHYLRSNGASASALGYGTGNNPVAGEATGASSTAGVFGCTVIDILDYTNTSKNKIVSTFHGQDQNGSQGNVWLTSSAWLSTSAVTSLTFTLQASTNFVQYSQFALYGIKAAA